MKLIWPIFQGSDTDLANAVALVRDHPASWGYYIGEEAFTSDQAAAVHAYSQKVHNLDPSHPRLYVGWGMSELQPTLGPFARDAEVLGADFYPVGIGVPIGRTASFASELTRVARSKDRQSATVLQAFNWASEPTLAPPGPHRWPTVDEMRRMRNLSYLAGDSGLMLWFDYYFIKPLGTTDMRHADALSKALAAPYPAKVGGLDMKRRALLWNQSRPGPLTVTCRQNGHAVKRQLSGNRARFRVNRACRGSGAAKVRVRTSAKRTLSSTTRSLSLRIGGKGRVRTLHQ
jgi:hypothetical protein